MFENVGQKIKGLAKFVCAIGIFLSTIIGIWVFYLLYSFSDNEFLALISAVVEIGFGVILSWLCVLALYGYGELIQNTADIRNQLCQASNSTSPSTIPQIETHTVPKPHWICKKCGRMNPAGSTSCWNCKEKAQ